MKHRICLCLPTNRACPATITALHQEAAYAVRHFDVDVHLLILDSADAGTRADHLRVIAALPDVPQVTVHHMDEDQQRTRLRKLIDSADLPSGLLDLLLPPAVSYGACTNRAFLVAAALGCRCGSCFHVVWNQEREKAGLDQDMSEDTSASVKVAVEGLKKIIQRDRELAALPNHDQKLLEKKEKGLLHE